MEISFQDRPPPTLSSTPKPCIRCPPSPSTPSVITLRNQALCQTHFKAFLSNKIAKRLDTLKFKGNWTSSPQKLLVAFSGGESSVAMLDLLVGIMAEKLARRGRNLNELIVVWVDFSALEMDEGMEGRLQSWSDKWDVEIRRHRVEEIVDVLRTESEDDDVLRTTFPILSSKEPDNAEILRDILASLPSNTSRADLTSRLLRRLISHLALTYSASAILYSHSTTRLAEETLAQASSGRGGSLPTLVSDGPDVHGTGVYFPQRELLRSDLASYIDLMDLRVLVVPEKELHITNMKNASVEMLMRRYFSSGGQTALVTNVVRTVEKLDPTAALGRDGEVVRCVVCGERVPWGEDGLRDWSGGGGLRERTADVLCYGCARTVEGVKV